MFYFVAVHRKKSYPHMHVPLKAMHSRSMRKHSSVSAKESNEEAPPGPPDAPKEGDASPSVPPPPPADSEPATSPPLSSATPSGAFISSPDADDDDDDDNTSRADDVTLLSSGSEAIRSERAAAIAEGSLFGSSPDRRVQFDIEKPTGASVTTDGKEEKDELGEDAAAREGSESERRDDEYGDRKHKRRHSRHKGSRKYSGVGAGAAEDPGWRKRSVGEERKYSIRPEEEELSNLQEVYQDDLASHRFDEPRGKRRFSTKSKNSIPSLSTRRDTGASIHHPLYKKIFDHSPHEVFVQLDELSGVGEEREWKETARWIKYEEDLEEGADRWGRPHVASLSFHSLLNLRRCLETGVILLDLEEKDLPGVAYRVVEQMVIDELISAENKATVMRALLLRHRHVQEHDRFRFSVRKNTASYTSLQSLDEDSSNCSEADWSDRNHNLTVNSVTNDHGQKVKIVPSASSLEVPAKDNHHNNHFPIGSESKLNHHHTVDMKEEVYTSSTEDLSRRAAKESILKRIPIGAEATTVLVGAVEFLEQPTIAFVRLAEGIFIPTITEVTIPVRFLFILLGPKDADLDYHEVGRSISTLMSNADFHNVAYRAIDRKELLSAINGFLDSSIVLPPGDWENQALLHFNEIKEKTEAIKRRQSRSKSFASAAAAEKKALLVDEKGEKKPPPFDPLRRTHRPFGGLFNDIRRRWPHYKSDIIDGLNAQCFAGAIFIYFAALSAAITFGGLLADKTGNLIGISETLVSTSLSGVLFGLISGQPLIIIGTTGPLLLFDESLYQFCQSNGIEYLTIRVYIGIWLGIIALVVSCFEGSVFVKLFTRFTEEIFASLISLLFIFESVMKICQLFKRHPLLSLNDYCAENNESNSRWMSDLATIPLSMMGNSSFNESLFDASSGNSSNSLAGVMPKPPESPKNQPNTALFCMIIALGTFFIAYYLRHFRNSKFLGRSVRRALGDFGVPISIVSMVMLDYCVPSTYSEKLKVPEGLSPSDPAVRGWLIPPSGLLEPVQPWVMIAAIVPALLVYILVFMETHITELIIAKKERKLKKGAGFHLDIVLVCACNVMSGLMGAPFMCAATVRSITHVSALTVMSRTHAPGEKPHITDVKEQRVSALLVSVLVGLSVTMAPLLRLVPMAVLFGVFLYMGISSINGIQFFERCRLFFVPVKHHTDAAYCRRVPTYKMHLYTVIQFLCLGILWVVKSSPISLAFPFFLILMVPLRAQLRFIFTPSELRALDSDEPDLDDREDEPDFYAESVLPG
ncbi:anion exchange protein 2 isoform X2 [Nilaparvata lugens]|uniref:anion exchange protein 2 isoform X2 n=1 Tax=Nilaparvata lugens TaxID=108931 RepID=UPI00193DF4E4|nr:anion exchange protein 2 isoform X2 [Nilaparvata lugens]